MYLLILIYINSYIRTHNSVNHRHATHQFHHNTMHLCVLCRLCQLHAAHPYRIRLSLSLSVILLHCCLTKAILFWWQQRCYGYRISLVPVTSGWITLLVELRAGLLPPRLIAPHLAVCFSTTRHAVVVVVVVGLRYRLSQRIHTNQELGYTLAPYPADLLLFIIMCTTSTYLDSTYCCSGVIHFLLTPI